MSIFTLTPEGDKNGVENRAGMIEEIRESGVAADVAQVPEIAADVLVAKWAHEELSLAVAHLDRRLIHVDGEDAVHEHQQTDDRRWQQPSRVKSCWQNEILWNCDYACNEF